MRDIFVHRVSQHRPLVWLLTGSLGAACLAQDAASEATPPTNDEPEQAEGPAVESPATDGDLTRVPKVIVTARKWEEDVSAVPQSISVLSGSFIEDSGSQSVRDTSFYVPNLFVNEFSSRRLSFPTIRGIGSGVGDPAVTTYIDGVPQLTISTTNIPLLDVERIEFLRGPQGTLYGRNSIGGLTHIITKEPSNTPAFRAQSTFGNFSLFEQSAGYTGPLVKDELYFSIIGQHSQRDGYTSNVATGNDVDFRDSTFGRASLLWTPGEQSSIRLTLYGEQARDGGFVLSSLDGLRLAPRTINQDFEGNADRSIRSAALTWNYEGDAVDFVSITSLQGWDIVETSDFDFSIIDGIRRRSTEGQTAFYQEVRFSSAARAPIVLSETADLRWLVGASFFLADSERSAENSFRPGGAGILFPPEQVGIDTRRGNFDDSGLALFTQGTLTLDDQLELTAGVRFDHESKEANVGHTFRAGGFTLLSERSSGDRDFDEVVPLFSAAYHVNDDVMVYGRAAKGFKAGGFNLAAPAGGLSFDPETSWTYEAGVKTSLFDEKMTLNASAFFIDWNDVQLSLFDAMVGGFIDNAAEATSKGLEVEMTASPSEGLDLFAGVGYTDATFDRFVDPFGQNVAGKHLAFVPDTTWNVGAAHSGRIGESDAHWFVRGEYVGVGTYYYDAGNRSGESFQLANFRAGIRCRNITVEGWIRNAFDQDYVLVAFQPSPVDPSIFVGESGAPQTFGLTVSIKF